MIEILLAVGVLSSSAAQVREEFLQDCSVGREVCWAYLAGFVDSLIEERRERRECDTATLLLVTDIEEVRKAAVERVKGKADAPASETIRAALKEKIPCKARPSR